MPSSGTVMVTGTPVVVRADSAAGAGGELVVASAGVTWTTSRPVSAARPPDLVTTW